MSTHPWISVSNENDCFKLWTHRISFCDLGPGSAFSSVNVPLITFVGTRRKSVILSQILGYSKPLRPHGQVFLARPRLTDSFNSEIYIDCELSTECSIRPESPACKPQTIGESTVALDIGHSLISNVFAPLSDVICYFAADLRGMPGICSILAYQAVHPKSHNLPIRCVPGVLVVVETQAARFDNESARQKLYSMTMEEMSRLKKYTNEDQMKMDLKSRFQDIYVFGVQKNKPLSRHAQMLRERVMSISKEVHMRRTFARYLFSLKHMDIIATDLLKGFCEHQSSFNFLKTTRPKGFDVREMSSHLTELFRLMPGLPWLWSVGIPLIASAIFLSNYPPGSHAFLPEDIYSEFYADHCKKALAAIITDPDELSRFVGRIKFTLGEMFQHFEEDPERQSAIYQHTQALESLWPHLATMKSFQSCLCCLVSRPEKVFECGHAICNVCVRRFGQRSTSARHSFYLPQCLLCGRFQSKDKTIFNLIPPSAGVRVLSIDGGGIRGVIPLVHLKHLEKELELLGSSIQDFFDYVCGTSAGGLVAIGVFLMQWTPQDCLNRFEEVALKTFKADAERRYSISQRIHSILRTLVRDHRYNLSPIEKAFGTGFETAMKMFNPLRSDTKVAVTATTVRGNVPCIHSNYNGRKSTDNNYQHVRAETFGHDISISDAAACTSAAPYYFKSKDVYELDTYQDGGLMHNNPALVATWECARLWPEKARIFEPESCRIDHLISLGTGTSPSHRYTVGPHSPKTDRFFHRLASWASGSLDSEIIWKRFLSCISNTYHSRFLRLNLHFPGTEPALNDVDSIEQLKKQTQDAIQMNLEVAQAKNFMIAGVFYFELDRFARVEGGGYECSGNILCRLTLDQKGRGMLYNTLQSHSTAFYMKSRKLASVDTIPQGNPPFRLMIDFVMQEMDDKLDISMKGITSRSMSISGMPITLNALIQAQEMDAPFGCIDGRVERLLPAIPSKRRFNEI